MTTFFFLDWIGIGFSDYGDPRNADLCILWADWRGRLYLQVFKIEDIFS